ncbi:DUF3618 domain-containing protein [Aeromicrobium sp. CF3.5]|uniref:DUF3618 domain-containing protein n=1 Tax=Aeromicrobium sp. CF3.5 TaxID=3373078 RepID=UPI003EE4C22A
MNQSDDLVREIDEIRDRLAGSVDELIAAVHPKSLLKRGIDSVKSRFVDETGAVRTQVVVPVAAGVVLVVVGAVVTRRILR